MAFWGNAIFRWTECAKSIPFLQEANPQMGISGKEWWAYTETIQTENSLLPPLVVNQPTWIQQLDILYRCCIWPDALQSQLLPLDVEPAAKPWTVVPDASSLQTLSHLSLACCYSGEETKMLKVKKMSSFKLQQVLLLQNRLKICIKVKTEFI